MSKDYYRYPTIGHEVYHELKRKLQNSMRYSNLKRRYLKKRYGSHSEDEEYTWIDPNEIEMMQLSARETSFDFRSHYTRVSMHSPDKGRFNPTQYAGTCMGGNWDNFVKPHRYDRIYRSLKKHIENDVPLEETEYGYSYYLRGKTYAGNKYTKAEIQQTKELIKNIRENGFKTRYEMGQLRENEPPRLSREQWGITVNIDRENNYIFNNTAHNRLAISKILGIEEVPVTVIVKHPRSS